MYRIFCHLQEQLFVEDVDDDESGSPADEDNQRFDEHEDGASPAGQHEEYFGYQNDPGSDDQEDEDEYFHLKLFVLIKRSKS